MKILLLFISMSFTSFGQNVVDFPDEEAKYPGGTAALQKFVAENFEYPEYYQFEDVGTIYISFIVDEGGLVKEPKVVRGVNKALDEKAIKLMNRMPQWEPAKTNRIPVASRMRLPIRINLR